MDYINDEKIMLEVKAGDIEKLSTLFEEYHVKLYNFFLRMTRNREISRDLTQDVFQRILKYRETYNPEHEFRTWMYQIARNSLYQHFNKNNITVVEPESNEQKVYENSSSIQEMERESKKKLLYEALALLSKEQREIIELARFQGLKYKEIAELTDSSVAAIKVKVHRAINRLREVYFEIA